MTGVSQYEASVTGKWLAMLKEIAPSLVRAAFVANPKTAIYYGYYDKVMLGEALRSTGSAAAGSAADCSATGSRHFVRRLHKARFPQR